MRRWRRQRRQRRRTVLRGRKSRWGVVNVEDPRHCKFTHLREIDNEKARVVRGDGVETVSGMQDVEHELCAHRSSTTEEEDDVGDSETDANNEPVSQVEVEADEERLHAGTTRFRSMPLKIVTEKLTGHLQDLIETTARINYEAFRSKQLRIKRCQPSLTHMIWPAPFGRSLTKEEVNLQKLD
jgi:hypothetical protein